MVEHVQKTLVKWQSCPQHSSHHDVVLWQGNAVKAYLQQFEDAFNTTGVPYPHCFFNDSYEVYNADWTPRMFEEFEKYRGYKLEEHMHELLGLATDENCQVLADYRATINDMLINNFTKQWTEWAHRHGTLTRNQAHGSPANLIDVYATVDIPEIEGFGLSEFGIKGLRTDKGFTRSNYSDDATLKYASSAAHITGKKLTSSETFTWLTEHFRTSLSQMKPDLDLMFLSGVNHVLFHGSTYSPKDAAWPGWKFYAAVDMSPTNSIWKDAPELMNYIERCQGFLQMGNPDNDFLIYAPFVNAWHKDKRKGALFADKLLTFPIDNLSSKMPEVKNAAQQVMNAGYDCDFISDKFILSSRVENGMIVTEGGAKYRGLIVPMSTNMLIPTDVKNRLDEMVAEGAKVVYQTDAETLDGMGAAIEPIRTELGLRTIRRSNDTGYHYFISNLTNQHVADYVSLSVPFNSLVMFDPMTGAIFTPAMNDEGKVYVDLKSGQSIILQTYTTEQVVCDSVYVIKDELEKVTLDGSWSLSFTDDSTPAISETYDMNIPADWYGIANLTIVQQRVIAIFAFATLMWVMEIVPSWATSVSIIVLMLLFTSDSGIAPMVQEEEVGKLLSYKSIMATFADPVIMLFIGGFILAIAATKTGLDAQLAKALLKPFGTRSEMVLLGFLLITGLFSMFVSNTATAAMMLTFLTPVFRQLPPEGKGRISMALAIPIAANLGGMGTPIGTPPNTIALKYLNDPEGLNLGLGFGQWMVFMFPLVIVLLIISWRILLWMFPFTQKTVELKIEGEMKKNAQTYIVIVTFFVTVLLWLLVIDVQRGGPSTGLPTKSEQTDLLQALYGRNGESPMPVIAATSPTNCFEAVYICPWNTKSS